MRYSLATLVLMSLWAGALVALYVRREPWNVVEKFSPTGYQQQGSRKSPDGRRYWDSDPRGTGVFEIKTCRVLWIFNWERYVEPATRYGDRVSGCFIDNETLDIVVYKNDKPESVLRFRRHFSEEWWGPFTRPELWMFVLVNAIIVMNTRKLRRESSAPTARNVKARGAAPETVAASEFKL